MDYTRRKEIGKLADGIRESLDLLKVPVDVNLAVKRLGGTVKHATEPGIEAQIAKKGSVSFEIQVPPEKYAVQRRRFSIAHELGHLFLHMGFLIDPPKWDSIDQYLDSPLYRYGFSEEEYEAHEFAGAFLMPETEFKQVAQKYLVDGFYDAGQIASHFDVSVRAATVRGQWLRVFAWG